MPNLNKHDLCAMGLFTYENITVSYYHDEPYIIHTLYNQPTLGSKSLINNIINNTGIIIYMGHTFYNSVRLC